MRQTRELAGGGRGRRGTAAAELDPELQPAMASAATAQAPRGYLVSHCLVSSLHGLVLVRTGETNRKVPIS